MISSSWGVHLGLVYVHFAIYLKLTCYCSILYIYSHLGGGMSVLGICTFCYMWNLHYIVVYHRSLIDGGWGWGVYICPGYMCIVLCVKLIQCSGIPSIYGQLEEGPWYMCILLYMKLLWCGSIPYIYGQLEGDTSALGICALCYMWNIFVIMVFHIFIVNWSGGYICPNYICIVLYVKYIWCSCIPYIYGQLECGGHSAIWEIYSV